MLTDSPSHTAASSTVTTGSKVDIIEARVAPTSAADQKPDNRQHGANQRNRQQRQPAGAIVRPVQAIALGQHNQAIGQAGGQKHHASRRNRVAAGGVAPAQQDIAGINQRRGHAQGNASG